MRKNWWENPAFQKTAQEREADRKGQKVLQKEEEAKAFIPLTKREKEIEIRSIFEDIRQSQDRRCRVDLLSFLDCRNGMPLCRKVAAEK